MRSLKGVSLIAGVTFCFASTALAQAGSPSKVDEANYVGDWGGRNFLRACVFGQMNGILFSLSESR